MKKPILKTFFLFFLISSCAAFPKKNTPENLRQEALDFSLEFVQSVFAKNCKKVFKKFNNKIFSIGDEETFKKKNVKKDICEALKNANKNPSKTYSDYLVDYKTEILSPTELQKRFKISFAKFYTPLENDFFFIGTDLKDSTKSSYINDDLFVISIRKKNKKWSIIGVGE